MRPAMTTWSLLDVADDSHGDERGRAGDLDLRTTHTSAKLQMQPSPRQLDPTSPSTTNDRVHCSEDANEHTRLIGTPACLGCSQDQGDHRARGPLYILFFAIHHQWPLPR